MSGICLQSVCLTADLFIQNNGFCFNNETMSISIGIETYGAEQVLEYGLIIGIYGGRTNA